MSQSAFERPGTGMRDSYAQHEEKMDKMKNNSANNGKPTGYSGKNRCKKTILLTGKVDLRAARQTEMDKSTF